MHNPESVLENETHKLLWGSETRRPDLVISNNNNKRTYRIVEIAVPVDHQVKLKEIEKKDKYFHFAKELKKIRNTKVTVILIVIDAFGRVPKRLDCRTWK